MSNLYFVDYDLRKQRNYQALYDALAKLGAVRILESQWCFHYASSGASELLRDHLTQYMDADDGICVSEISGWATKGALKTPKNL